MELVSIVNVKSGRCLQAKDVNVGSQLILMDCNVANPRQSWFGRPQPGSGVAIHSAAVPFPAITLQYPGWNGSNLQLGPAEASFGSTDYSWTVEPA